MDTPRASRPPMPSPPRSIISSSTTTTITRPNNYRASHKLEMTHLHPMTSLRALRRWKPQGQRRQKTSTPLRSYPCRSPCRTESGAPKSEDGANPTATRPSSSPAQQRAARRGSLRTLGCTCISAASTRKSSSRGRSCRTVPTRTSALSQVAASRSFLRVAFACIGSRSTRIFRINREGPDAIDCNDEPLRHF